MTGDNDQDGANECARSNRMSRLAGLFSRRESRPRFIQRDVATGLRP